MSIQTVSHLTQYIILLLDLLLKNIIKNKRWSSENHMRTEVIPQWQTLVLTKCDLMISTLFYLNNLP